MGHPRVFINAHQPGPDALRLAASLGIGGVRVDANLPDLQPAPDQWTWQWLDDLVATCQTLNLQVYCTLSQTPAWMGPINRGDLPPLCDWQRFCREFAQHFKGRLTYIGVWNEFQGSAEDYVMRLLRPCAEAFRAVDSTYKICGPDMDMRQGWPAWLAEVLRRGGDCLNVTTVHVYGNGSQRVWDQLTRVRKWWEFWKPPSIQQVIEQAGWRGPVWVTETGWKSAELGEDGQARAVEQFLLRLLGEEWPAGVCLFQLLDEPSVSFGLIDQHGRLKLAAEVVQRYTGRGVV